MNKLTQILLSALFLFNSCGYIFSYFQLANIFRNEALYKINNGYPADEVTIIEDSPAVEKLDDNEIRINGALFDIIKKEIKNGKQIFYCLHDAPETNLENILNNHVDRNSERTSTAPVKNIISNLISDILIPSEDLEVINTSDVRYSNNIISDYKLTYKKVFTPPPQSA